MKYDIKKDNDRLVVAVEGELDVRTSPDFEKALMPALQNMKTVTFDMKELTYLSSAGLRVLLGALQAMEDKGEMVICNLTPPVHEVFELTGFSRLFNIE